MKLSSILCASLVALAALALAPGFTLAQEGKMQTAPQTEAMPETKAPGTATPAPAETTTINSTKSNTFKTVNSDPKAVQDCKVHGGAIGKDPKGQDACITYSASKPSGCSQWIGDICVIWKH
jgi:hypothetical protein